MTTEQINLRNELIKEIEARNFKFLRFYNCETGATLYLEGHYDEHDYTSYGYTFKGYFGYTIDVRETYRCNGTSENKSCYITVMKWHENTGSSIERVKISQKDGARKRQNAIEKIVNAYMEAIRG